MSNLPLAFAEILIGGIFATAGITGDSFSNIIKGDITVNKLAGGSSSSSTGSSSSGSTSGGSSSTVTGSASTAYGKLIGADGITPTNFATSLLQAIGAPLSKANIKSIVDWETLEGGNWENTARFNPLDTTLQEPGSEVMPGGNSAGVQAYNSWAQGLEATVQTLEGSDYSDIIATLDKGNGLVGDINGLYIWSGHGYSSVN